MSGVSGEEDDLETKFQGIPIPSSSSTPRAPLTPSEEHDHLDDAIPPTNHMNVSPSFDYHEERRLHLADETWLSHHLPRLPPTSYPHASGSLSTAGDASAWGLQPAQAIDGSKTRLTPGNLDIRGSQAVVSTGDTQYGAEPSPGHSSMELDNEDEETVDQIDDTVYLDQGFHQRAGPSTSPHRSLRTRNQDSQDRTSGISRLNLEAQEEEDERKIGKDYEHFPIDQAYLDTTQEAAKVNQTRHRKAPSEVPAEHTIGSELKSLYGSFAKCLELRDKYMALSCQRLGDNPRDHDGTFQGFYPPESGDVNGLRPDANLETCESQPVNGENKAAGDFEAWTIYPPPPPPHWHWKPAEDGIRPEHRNGDGDQSTDMAREPSRGGRDSQAFRFEDCQIPGLDKRNLEFSLNDEGVYEVLFPSDQAAREGETSNSSLPSVMSWGDSSQYLNPKTVDEKTSRKGKKRLSRVPSLKEYFTDLDYLLGVCSDGPAKSFAFRRLRYLTSKWSLYCLLNEYQELADMKAVPHRDFYNVRKVDTHIHHSASMNQKHLLRFIKSKLKKVPNEIVIHRDGQDLTLQEVFESLKLTAYDLSIDTLDMHAHQEFHRFDRFNDRYNPTGSSRLREIFLKTDNLLKGKYLAELTQELIADLEQSKYQVVEWRLSIYGRNVNEWDKLAKWVIHNKLLSHNVRWLIQIPRLYNVYKASGQVQSFEDIVKNIFQPLFEVTQDPSTHPELHVFLQRVVGFDSVDDESKPERRLYRKYPTASMWTTAQSPPYSYWIYYMYANMSSLNNWRRSRGFNTFVLRPHCGEAGDPDHLSSAFLTSHSISHGILLRKVPALQYLFYLKQIGLAMSPLSNNALFLTYERNPFKDFFRTGLNVSLSTDDPLQFHFTASQLLEEYSCAAQIYKLTPADMCELARNSVIQSGWEMQVKKHWIGHKWYLPGAAGNDIHKTNVPTIRLTYRHSTLLEELALIHHGHHSPPAISAPRPITSTQPTSPITATSAHHNRVGPGVPTRADDVGAAAMLGTATTATAQSTGADGQTNLKMPFIQPSHTLQAVQGVPGQAQSNSVTTDTHALNGVPAAHIVEGASALDEKARRKRSQSNLTRDVHEFRR